MTILIQYKENSSNDEDQQLYISQNTSILNDFLVIVEFKHVMKKLSKAFFSYYMYQMSIDSIFAQIMEENAEKMEEFQKVLDACCYCLVEYDLIL